MRAWREQNLIPVINAQHAAVLRDRDIEGRQHDDPPGKNRSVDRGGSAGGDGHGPAAGAFGVIQRPFMAPGGNPAQVNRGAASGLAVTSTAAPGGVVFT